MSTSNENTPHSNDNATDTIIDLDTAQNYIRNWLLKFPEVEPADRPKNLCPFQAWFISKEDILGLSNIVNGDAYIGVRAYLGIDPNYSTDDPYNGPMKLMLVPVLSKANSDPDPYHDPGTDQLFSADASSTIYDFTRPCPTLCDTSSPLYWKQIPDMEDKFQGDCK